MSEDDIPKYQNNSEISKYHGMLKSDIHRCLEILANFAKCQNILLMNVI